MYLARQVERIIPERVRQRSKLSCELYGWLGFQDTHVYLTERYFQVSSRPISEVQVTDAEFELELARNNACLHQNRSYRLLERGFRYLAVKCKEDVRFANARMIYMVEGQCDVSAPNLLIVFRPSHFRVRISRRNLPSLELRFQTRSCWRTLPEDVRQFLRSTKINKLGRRGIISG